jgi:hypothetical protein
MSLRGGLDFMEKINVTWPYRESNADLLVVQSAA